MLILMLMLKLVSAIRRLENVSGAILYRPISIGVESHIWFDVSSRF